MAKVQVAIVGAGPSGMLLSQLLSTQGIDSIVLEHHTRAHVEARIRAGLLEWSTVELIELAGAGARMRRKGLPHEGVELAFDDQVLRIDLMGLCGQRVMVYGQTEIQRDLTEARIAGGARIVWEAKDVAIHDVDGSRPRVSWSLNGERQQTECDYIAGCDGYHGVSRASIPPDRIMVHERSYPFGWLGVLADVPPVSNELVYVNHARGFALCSMRSRTRSRYYLQCPIDDQAERWSDQCFWDELAARLPPQYATQLRTGASIEKSIAALRSFVAEPMRFGRLFLVGDAAHIVPPTGAKGLNLAAADVRVLFEGLVEYYRGGSERLLQEYSARALARVWKATRFSWWFTTLMHRLSDDSFARKLQLAELRYLQQSQAAAAAFAENYAGLGF
ncbi:MAG: 4-hydroxybenzoate 3-monooxygenase [Steroidobacteraceae bacterium]